MKKYFLSTILITAATLIMAQVKVEPPVLIAPANAATKQMPDLMLDWKAVIGALNYELQLSEDEAFTTIVLDSITDLTAVKSSMLKFCQEYYWRVRALYPGNIHSDWSTVWMFTIFSNFDLVKPNDNAENVPPDTELKWKDKVGPLSITGVSYFEIQIDSVDTFDSPEFHEFFVGGNVFKKDMSNLLFGTKYYWRARAGHDKSVSEWSDVRSFTTVGKVTLQRPNNNSVDNDLNVNLRWGEITGILKYEYQIDVDGSFSAPMVELTENIIEPASNLMYGTQYYWRVRARHSRDTTNWSDVWNFTTFNFPTLTSPADNDTGIILRPQLKWDQIKGSIKYEINLSLDEATLSDHKYYKDASDAELPHYNVAPDLEPLTKYYWRVRAFSEIDTSDFSSVWSFTTYTPVGINEYFASSNVNLYPNPVQDAINIEITCNKFTNVDFVIYDLLGQAMLKDNLNLNSGHNQVQIDARTLLNGIYMVNIMYGDQVITKKLVVSK